MLVVLIVGHEAGHLLAAKRAGMHVPEFGIGFPPKVWSRTVGGTEYSVNALPFGGFVRIVGEDGDGTHEHAFGKKSKWAQAGVLCAGPGMNIVLGFIAFWIAFMVGFPTALEDAGNATLSHPRVVVTDVLPGSPAEGAGVSVGDTVVSITRGNVTTLVERPSDISDALQERPDVVKVVTLRGDTEHTYTLVPKTGVITDAPDRLAIGLGSLILADASYGVFESLWRATLATGRLLVSIVTGIAQLLIGAVTFSASLEGLSGPVGIASVVSDAAKVGVGQVLAFAAVISLNLAVLNLLPFPALDGGRLLFLGIEVLRGRPVPARTTALVNNVGFVLLILLMLVVTWHDIARLVA